MYFAMERIRSYVTYKNTLVEVVGIASDRCRIVIARVDQIKSLFFEPKIESAAATEQAHNCKLLI